MPKVMLKAAPRQKRLASPRVKKTKIKAKIVKKRTNLKDSLRVVPGRVYLYKRVKRPTSSDMR